MRKLVILATFLFVFLFPNLVQAVELPARVKGSNRLATSIEISKIGWSGGSGTVVLANGYDFPDALAGTPLAYKLNAPILLTDAPSLDNLTKSEIIRLRAKNIVILGGERAVSKSVEDSLIAMGLKVERIAGVDRYETAAKIAERIGVREKAVLAYGLNFPDALGIASFAAKNGYPILLTQKETLPETTVTAFTYVQETYVIGGSGVISNTVLTKLPKPQRIAGTNRYGTVAEIVRRFGPNVKEAYIATGKNFADALTGSVLAAKNNLPLILVEPKLIPKETKAIIKEKGLIKFAVFGGPNAVGDKVRWDLVLPLNLYGKKFVLDSGHGGMDPGAVRKENGFKEKDLNLPLTKKIIAKLQALGATVIMVPQPASNAKLELHDRAEFANAQKPDLFISIHHDSSTDKSVRGISTHYSSFRPAIETKDVYVRFTKLRNVPVPCKDGRYPLIYEDTAKRGFYINYNGKPTFILYDSADYDATAYDPTPDPAVLKSADLANRFANALASLGFAKPDNTPRDHNLHLTRWTTMPSVIIEAGFMSNAEDFKLASDPVIQDKQAQKITDVIRGYFGS